jgi:NDP-sugar pyrophosphorylase family protein
MTQIVILAGGLGTRLGNLTSKTPKCLVEISGSPFLDIQLRLIESKGCTKALLCIGHLGEMVVQYLNSRKPDSMKVEYCVDQEPNIGTLGALINAREFLDDVFFVTFGDSYLDINYQSVVQKFNELDCDILMTFSEFVGESDFPNIMKTSNSSIRYQKNSSKKQGYTHTDFGLLMMRKEALTPLSEYGNDLAEALEKFSNFGSVKGFDVAARYHEIGSVLGIKELENHLKEKQNEIY